MLHRPKSEIGNARCGTPVAVRAALSREGLGNMRMRVLMLGVATVAAVACIPFLSSAPPAGKACSINLDCSTDNSGNYCDDLQPGGYCTRPCSTPPGVICVAGWSPAANDGACGLPLKDGGLGCAQICELDGGLEFGTCRSGYRCVPAADDGGTCSDASPCPFGICIP